MIAECLFRNNNNIWSPYFRINFGLIFKICMTSLSIPWISILRFNKSETKIWTFAAIFLKIYLPSNPLTSLNLNVRITKIIFKTRSRIYTILYLNPICCKFFLCIGHIRSVRSVVFPFSVNTNNFIFNNASIVRSINKQQRLQKVGHFLCLTVLRVPTSVSFNLKVVKDCVWQ